MTTTLTFLGHSAFQIETGGHSLLIDPFLTGNPVASTTAADLRPDAIFVSHGHADHLGDTIEIARRTNALVIANHEIITWLRGHGVTNTHDMHLGGSHQFPFGSVKLTVAHHGSMLPDGSYGGNPAGILLGTEDGLIYHAGDTALFGDMRLTGDRGLKLAILPIGDNYTMGPDDAVLATQLLRPEFVMPMHFNTFPLIRQDAAAWSADISVRTQALPVVLNPGQSWSIHDSRI